MQVYENRLSTFHSSDGRALWPHEDYKATPELLASAGFFYKATATGSDNVCCFLCEKELDGWSVGDHPYAEHACHSPLCPWVLVKCLGRNDLGLVVEPELSMIRDAVSAKEGNYSEQDDVELGLPPRSKIMETARLKTFGDWWPHEGKRGWLVKGPKLSKAGFYYAPSPDAEDSAVCGFCQLTLDQWEPRDSPVNEHRERQPQCPFFYKPKHPTAKSASSRSTKSTRISSRRSSVASVLDGEDDEDDAASVISDTQSVHELSPDRDRHAAFEGSGNDNAMRDPEPEPPTPAKRGGRKPRNAAVSRRTGKKTAEGEESKAPIEADPAHDLELENDNGRKIGTIGDVNVPKKRAASTKAKQKITALLDEHISPPKRSTKDIKSGNRRPPNESDTTILPDSDVSLAQRKAKPRATTRTGRSPRATQLCHENEQRDADDQERIAADLSVVDNSSGKGDAVEGNVVPGSNEHEGEKIQIPSEDSTATDIGDAQNKKAKVIHNRKGTRKVQVPEPIEPVERADPIRQPDVFIELIDSSCTDSSPKSLESSQNELIAPVKDTTTDADNTGLSEPVETEPDARPVRKSRRVLKSKTETTKKGRPSKKKAVEDQKALPHTTTTETPSLSRNEETPEIQRDMVRSEETDAVTTIAVDECDVPQDENLPPIPIAKTQSENVRRKRESLVPTFGPLTTAEIPNRNITDEEDASATDEIEKSTKKVTPVVADVPQTPSLSRHAPLFLSRSEETPSESEEESQSGEEENAILLSDEELSARYGVTERELDMTVEEFMKSIMQAQVERLQLEGEKLVQKLLIEGQQLLGVS